eukprot:2523849-Rhodomonas_salina.2
MDTTRRDSIRCYAMRGTGTRYHSARAAKSGTEMGCPAPRTRRRGRERRRRGRRRESSSSREVFQSPISVPPCHPTQSLCCVLYHPTNLLCGSGIADSTTQDIVLCLRYAVSGTGAAYAATNGGAVRRASY